MAKFKKLRSIVKIVTVAAIVLGGHVLAPLGVLWASACDNTIPNAPCPARSAIRYGFAAAAGLSVVIGCVSAALSSHKRSGIIIAVINFVICDWIITVLVASFLCHRNAGTAPGRAWAASTPLLLVAALSMCHQVSIARGKIMPLWYRRIFAVAYSLSTTPTVTLFLFAPAIAAIPQASLAWIPFGIAFLLTIVGIRQSWTSPRPLHLWEYVEIDLSKLFATGGKQRWLHSDDIQPVPVDTTRVLLGSMLPTASGESAVMKPSMRESLPLSQFMDAAALHQWLAAITPAVLRDDAELEHVAQRIEHRLDAHHQRVRVPNPVTTPPAKPLELNQHGVVAKDGQIKDILTVVQITDPHLGSYMTPNQLRVVCERALLLQPDLVFLTGDFFTAEAHEDETALTFALEPLSRLAPGRVFACFGNHDLEGPHVTKLVESAMKHVGARLLSNEVAFAHTAAGVVEVVGLHYYRPFQAASAFSHYFHSVYPSQIETEKRCFQQSTNAASIEAMPRQRFVLLHDPSGFHHVPSSLQALVFSGHTHGGHIGLYSFGYPHVTAAALLGLLDNGLWTSSNETCDGNAIYVHRGQGARSLMSQAVVRLGVPSEDSVLRIRLPTRASQ